jgi:agmatinase
VTTSYGGGTSQAPRAILKASKQVDLFDIDVLRPYEAGLFLLPIPDRVESWNAEGKALAKRVIEVGGEVGESAELKRALERVNELGEELNRWMYHETSRVLSNQQIAAVLGGDHSVPLGALQAVAEKRSEFGILHFDAHSDTRKAYEGFEYSHASIMYNVMERIPAVKKLVQVGIRDFCEEEWDYLKHQRGRIHPFFDRDLATARLEGKSWGEICQPILAPLPKEVWVSFDIDGLDPRFCPHTGTPVPGGLDFHQACYLLTALVRSGRKIIGFDLNEVAPAPSGESEWDANVGARLLYKLSALTLVSQGKAKWLTPRA